LKGNLTDSSRAKILHTVIVLAIALFGMSQKKLTYEKTSMFQVMVIEIVGFGQSKTMSVKESITSFFDHYIFIVNTSKVNKKLVHKVHKLENKIFQYEEVKKENGRLKQLLQFGKELKREEVLAQIISWDSNNAYVFKINKGSNHGIKEQSPVITLNGLVGYVYRVTPNYSDVLTIQEQNNRVDAIVTRTRSHGIVEGTSNETCRMKYVVRTEEVREGDQIITAGLGNIYPKGIKVGVISNVEKETYGITQYIEVTPSVDFHRLEEVVILTHLIPEPVISEEKESEENNEKEVL
jgi:rod shape-determining protein MreC